MMKLKEYLNQNNITVAEFALSLGLRKTSVHRYINGDRKPRPIIAMQIVAETGGAVTLESLYTTE